MLKEKLLSEIERKLLKENKSFDEGTRIEIELTSEEKAEFLNDVCDKLFDFEYWWEFEENLLTIDFRG